MIINSQYNTIFIYRNLVSTQINNFNTNTLYIYFFHITIHELSNGSGFFLCNYALTLYD